jgi:anaerobic selenocysteine-containing dehydrogenase
MGKEFWKSACPHDCPSACSLEVERLSSTRIGRVRGAAANTYTDGVVCAKVARYAERVHHPDRLKQPLQRVGEKGKGEFRPISWDDALNEVAEAFTHATRTHGSEAVWPYHSGGTMGVVQRWGLDRLRHAFGYSRQKTTICVTPAESGWRAGVGKLLGPDPREMAESDLIVVWGGNPVSTQVNAMTHIAKARKQRGAKLAVVDVYRTPTVEAADIGLVLRPGTDGALALAMMHVLLKEALPTATTWRAIPTSAQRSRRISPTRRRNGRRPSPACPPRRSQPSRGSMAVPNAASCGWVSASRARATARPPCMP